MCPSRLLHVDFVKCRGILWVQVWKHSRVQDATGSGDIGTCSLEGGADKKLRLYCPSASSSFAHSKKSAWYSVLGSFASNSIPDLHKLNSQNYLVFHPMFGVFGPKAQYYHTLTFWYWYSSLRNTNEIPSVPHCCLRPCRYPNYCILLVILVSSLPANPFLVQFHPFLVHSWSLFHGACRPHVDSIPHIRKIKTSPRVIVFSTTPGFRTKSVLCQRNNLTVQVQKGEAMADTHPVEDLKVVGVSGHCAPWRNGGPAWGPPRRGAVKARCHQMYFCICWRQIVTRLCWDTIILLICSAEAELWWHGTYHRARLGNSPIIELIVLESTTEKNKLTKNASDLQKTSSSCDWWFFLPPVLKSLWGYVSILVCACAVRGSSWVEYEKAGISTARTPLAVMSRMSNRVDPFRQPWLK